MNRTQTVVTMTPAMRRFVQAAAGLTFVGGLLLFGPSDNTEDWWAWTISPPLTAAFLGANFWATSVASYLAVRRGIWDSARLVVPAVGVLMTFTLVATLIHLDRFDFRSIFGWGWLVAYGLFPAFLLPILAEQRQAAGAELERQPFSFAVALALSLLGFGLVSVGTALFLEPAETAKIWPWALTPLTGRAVGAWLLAYGVAALHAAWERDWLRFSPIAATYVGVGILQLVALVRWSDAVDFDSVSAWIYVGSVLAMFALGVAGVAATRRKATHAAG